MILVLRHGQDEDNARGILNGRRDPALTEHGRAQIRAVAEQLLSDQLDLIVTSPLNRARASAEIVARRLGCPEPIVVPGLVERDFGILTGKPVTDIPVYSTRILRAEGVDYFLEAEGAEDFPAVLVRAAGVLDQLRADHGSKRMLIVTHGDLAKMLRAAYYRWPWVRGLQTRYLDNGGLFRLEQDEGNE